MPSIVNLPGDYLQARSFYINSWIITLIDSETILLSEQQVRFPRDVSPVRRYRRSLGYPIYLTKYPRSFPLHARFYLTEGHTNWSKDHDVPRGINIHSEHPPFRSIQLSWNMSLAPRNLNLFVCA